ncbi:hypothetical protein ACET3Z_000684 [Daucus carota]
MSTAQDGIMNNDNEKLQTALDIINLIKQKLGENYSSKENIERAERRAKSVMVTLKYRCNIGIDQCHAFCKCKVYPKFGLSLDSKNLDTVLSFVHQFERENLMDAGDKVFSISYVVAYALTNSHHSIDYKKSEYIELEDVFSDIGSVEEKQFSEISPLESSWAIDIARNKPHLGEKPRMSFRGKNLMIGESSTSNTDNLLRNVSTRIDNLSQKLDLLS